MSATATATRVRSAAPAHPNPSRPNPSRGVPRRELPVRPPHLRVVEQPGRLERRRRGVVALVGIAAVVVIFTVVVFQAFLAQNQVAIDRLERRTAAAERRYEQARFEHALRSAPQRIIERASALGLVAPDAPPTAIAVAGETPASPSATSSTVRGVADVKATLGTAP